jgi:signal transduction histidine kinase/CheY-like chemotaxis protein
MARAQALSLELGTTIAPGFEALAFKASREIEDSYELTYIRKDGSRFPAVVSITALRDDYGDIIGYLLIGTDNSVRKRVQTELNEAMAAAEKASRAKTDFLSGMSHELRTPLNAILGFAQLVESGSPSPTPSQKRSLDQILKAGWYLLELINEILDLALIESGKLTLSREPVSLVEVMLECRAMIEPQAQKRGIGMTFPRFEIPYFVKADRTRVKQVLINLLFNAIKYNKPGGAVAVECALASPASIRISVRDTGVGLAPEQLAQLFQPFNRLGKESGTEEGTGIGLVVTKRLVDLMGGTIGADSTVGVGSVFWIELTRTSAPQLAVEQAVLATLTRPEVAVGGALLRTLLYVEDNPANLELVEQLIARRPDLRLLSAADGNIGVEFARAYQPEVILMDINLPGLSGIEALHILRADPATAHIPVIALSANAVPRDIEKGLEAGFFNYLTKPIKVNQFMDALDVALKLPKPASSRAATKEPA